MGTLTESSSFDATVHQIETTDAVLGGDGAPINTSLQAITNRTRYLIDQLTALLASAAPIVSPTFTGTVRAPTVAGGDSSTKIATTGFANNLARGIATVDVTGLGASVTLTAAQYGPRIVLLIGTLAANTNVIFPNSGEWIVDNQTSGAFSLTCKTAGGSGTAVSQGKVLPILCDGTNTQPSLTDTVAIAPFLVAVTNITPAESDRGRTFYCTGQPGFTVTLDPSNLVAGWYASFLCPAGGITFAAAGAAHIDGAASRTADAGTDVTIYFTGSSFLRIAGRYSLPRGAGAGTWSNGSTITFSHSLGNPSTPRVSVYATCITAEGGYAAPLQQLGDTINVTGQVSAVVGQSNIYVVIPSAGISAFNRSTQAAFTLTPAKWSLTAMVETY